MTKNYIKHKTSSSILLYYLRLICHGILHLDLPSKLSKVCVTFIFLFSKGIAEVSKIYIAIALSH